MWFCPHCNFGPLSGNAAEPQDCPLCKQRFTIPAAVQPIRIPQHKDNGIPFWLGYLALVCSVVGGLLCWYAFAERNQELLRTSKAIVGAGFALFLASRITRCLD